MEILSGSFHTYKAQTEISHKGELNEWQERLTSTLKEEKEKEKTDLGKSLCLWELQHSVINTACVDNRVTQLPQTQSEFFIKGN